MNDLILSLVDDVVRDVVVADGYVEFEFESGGRMRCFVRPRVMFEGYQDVAGDDHYESSLRGLIGHAVCVADISDDIAFVLGFDEVFGALEVQSPNDREPMGSEVARFSAGGDVVVWRVGEPPFADAEPEAGTR